eukprot:2465060-Rhodomonas_salina.1
MSCVSISRLTSHAFLSSAVSGQECVQRGAAGDDSSKAPCTPPPRITLHSSAKLEIRDSYLASSASKFRVVLDRQHVAVSVIRVVSLDTRSLPLVCLHTRTAETRRHACLFEMSDSNGFFFSRWLSQTCTAAGRSHSGWQGAANTFLDGGRIPVHHLLVVVVLLGLCVQASPIGMRQTVAGSSWGSG